MLQHRLAGHRDRLETHPRIEFEDRRDRSNNRIQLGGRGFDDEVGVLRGSNDAIHVARKRARHHVPRSAGVQGVDHQPHDLRRRHSASSSRRAIANRSDIMRRTCRASASGCCMRIPSRMRPQPKSKSSSPSRNSSSIVAFRAQSTLSRIDRSDEFVARLHAQSYSREAKGTAASPSAQQLLRILQHLHHGVQESRAFRAIHHAVIATRAQRQH